MPNRPPTQDEREWAAIRKHRLQNIMIWGAGVCLLGLGIGLTVMWSNHDYDKYVKDCIAAGGDSINHETAIVYDCWNSKTNSEVKTPPKSNIEMLTK